MGNVIEITSESFLLYFKKEKNPAQELCDDCVSLATSFMLK